LWRRSRQSKRRETARHQVKSGNCSLPPAPARRPAKGAVENRGRRAYPGRRRRFRVRPNASGIRSRAATFKSERSFSPRLSSGIPAPQEGLTSRMFAHVCSPPLLTSLFRSFERAARSGRFVRLGGKYQPVVVRPMRHALVAFCAFRAENAPRQPQRGSAVAMESVIPR
jgi:hypothetical protein